MPIVDCITRCSMYSKFLNLNVVSVRHILNLIIIESGGGKKGGGLGANGVLVIINTCSAHRAQNMNYENTKIYDFLSQFRPLIQRCSLFASFCWPNELLLLYLMSTTGPNAFPFWITKNTISFLNMISMPCRARCAVIFMDIEILIPQHSIFISKSVTIGIWN